MEQKQTKKPEELRVGDVAFLNGAPGLVRETSSQILAGFCGRQITTITIAFEKSYQEEIEKEG